MTTREEELTANAASQNIETAIDAVVALCHEFLFPRGDYEKAEYLIFEKMGFQLPSFGFILELTLAEAYLSMGEISRARRFTAIALTSSVDSVKEKAADLNEKIAALA